MGVPVAVAPADSLTLERNVYYGARLVGQVAQNLLFAALFVVAGTSSHAAIGMSSVFAAMLVPSFLFGLPGGALADKLGPARGMAAGALMRFAVAATAVAFMNNSGEAWLIAFAYSAVSQVYSPAELALVRGIRTSGYGRAHSLLIALQYGGQGIGVVLLAPVLWWIGGAQAIAIGAAAGFAILSLVVAFLARRLIDIPEAGPATDAHAFSFRQTCSFFRREPLARDAVTILAMKSLVTQVIVVALPLYLTHDIGLGHSALAFLVGPAAAGTIAGLLWAAPAVTRERAGWFMRAGLLGMTVGLFALATLDYTLVAMYEYTPLEAMVHFQVTMNTTFAVALPVAFLIGLSLSIALVAARAALTETAPVGQQARVFAVQSSITEVIVITPLLLMGFGAQYAGARPALAGIALLGALAFVAIQHPRFRVAAQPSLEPAVAPVPLGLD